ncbi:MAG: hypothetical protein RL885_17830 [Planctomycetota bacterium]
MLDIPEIVYLRPPPQSMASLFPEDSDWTHDEALAQHQSFAAALEQAGLEVRLLHRLERCPRSVQIADVAAISLDRAFISRFFDPKRRGEEIELEQAIQKLCVKVHAESPAKVFGGDVVFSDFGLWIGLSSRTNDEGADQLTAFFEGYDIVRAESETPLRARMTYLDRGRFLARSDTTDLEFLDDYETIEVPEAEGAAAEAIILGRHLVLPESSDQTKMALEGHGFEVTQVDVSKLLFEDRGIASLGFFCG